MYSAEVMFDTERSLALVCRYGIGAQVVYRTVYPSLVTPASLISKHGDRTSVSRCEKKLNMGNFRRRRESFYRLSGDDQFEGPVLPISHNSYSDFLVL